MAPTKSTNDDENARKRPKKLNITCGVKGPGPAHMLRPVVGYKDHCLSKYRNPAYTIGRINKRRPPCLGPGPKYYLQLPLDQGYTFPKAVQPPSKECSPGPKYTLPNDECIPAFSIVGKPRVIPPPCGTLYDPPKYPPGPAFTFGGKSKGDKCQFSPPIRDIGPVDLVRTRGPTFNIQGLTYLKEPCRSPGPAKYYPKILKKAPTYIFGIRHSECKTIPRTECDDMC